MKKSNVYALMITSFTAHNDHCWLQKSAGRSLDCRLQKHQPPAVPRSWVGFQTFFDWFVEGKLEFVWIDQIVRGV